MGTSARTGASRRPRAGRNTPHDGYLDHPEIISGASARPLRPLWKGSAEPAAEIELNIKLTQEKHSRLPAPAEPVFGASRPSVAGLVGSALPCTGGSPEGRRRQRGRRPSVDLREHLRRAARAVGPRGDASPPVRRRVVVVAPDGQARFEVDEDDLMPTCCTGTSAGCRTSARRRDGRGGGSGGPARPNEGPVEARARRRS